MGTRIIMLLLILCSVLHLNAQRDSATLDTIPGYLSYKTVLYGFHDEKPDTTTVEGMTARKFVNRQYCKNSRNEWELCSENLIAVEIFPNRNGIWQAFDWRNNWWKFKASKLPQGR